MDVAEDALLSSEVSSSTDWTVTSAGRRTVLYSSILSTESSTEVSQGRAGASSSEEVTTRPSPHTSTVSASCVLDTRPGSAAASTRAL